MDIKTADRLQELRKKYGYSQETLSEKLGVSRQAISKWERGESSPDTDNLIMLSKIYGITLDDILNPEADINIPVTDEKRKQPGIYSERGKALFKFPFAIIVTAVYVIMNLILHAWHPSWIMFLLIPIYYHYAGACFAKTKKGLLLALPVPEAVVLFYLLLGVTFGIWGPGAILFIIIPVYYWAIAFYKKK